MRSSATPALECAHGGALDAAVARWGGVRADWLDLSTGINPMPWPVPALARAAWAQLPDSAAQQALIGVARQFWNVPQGAQVVVAPGVSAIIARLPAVLEGARVHIPAPTYSEHAAAFAAHGWQVDSTPTAPQGPVQARVVVHPNNPTGHLWEWQDLRGVPVVVDESFCDVAPEKSLVAHAGAQAIILKSFGKFWGLAGLRLGFAIMGASHAHRLCQLLGPWPVSGPALAIATRALSDSTWAEQTRHRLRRAALRLDRLMTRQRVRLIGGCDLFRLYETEDARAWQERLAQHYILCRIFRDSPRLLRLGLPPPGRWQQLQAAL